MFPCRRYNTIQRVAFSLAALVFSLFPLACNKTKPAQVEAPPAYQPPPAEAVVAVPTVVAPKLIEVTEAVQRIFKAAAVIDSNVNPNFAAGDFNGDGTQDIAVIIRVAPGKLSEMNQEYPPWLLRDALNPSMQKSGILRVNENEALLAIIHGYGPNDWRDPQATQTFLLKNAVGSELEVRPGKEFVKANKGKRVPPVRGDFIAENIGGNRGYIYYSVATYGWFDPKTYRGEPAAGVVHPITARN